MSEEDASGRGDPDLNHPVCRAAVEALERADVGLILTDRSAAVKFINKVAQPQMSGPAFLLQKGRLTTAEPRAALRLHRTIWEVASGPAARDQLVSIPTDVAQPEREVLVAGLSIASAKAAERRLAMIILSDRGGRTTESLPDRVELTRAETRLLRALVNGQRVGAYAVEAGIALSTAKTHLRGLFDKTGERRQADLIRRALSDPKLRGGWQD